MPSAVTKKYTITICSLFRLNVRPHRVIHRIMSGAIKVGSPEVVLDDELYFQGNHSNQP